MARFNLSNFNDNIRVSLSRKKIGLPPKKFTTEKLHPLHAYSEPSNISIFASAAFIVAAVLAATFMIICLIIRINDKNSEILNILTPITFILSGLALISLIFKQRDRMTLFNALAWSFNSLIWGMDTFNIWIYAN